MKLFTLIAFFCLASCGTYKAKTSEKIDKVSESSVQILQKETDYTSLLDSITSYLKQNVHINHTEYYPRDSTGIQDIKFKTEIDLNSEKTEIDVLGYKLVSDKDTDLNKHVLIKQNSSIIQERKVDTKPFTSIAIVLIIAALFFFFQKKLS